jgi:hypothetical protein
MIYLFGFLSFCLGVVFLVITISGAPSDVKLWLIGIGLIAFGVGGPAFAIRQETKRKEAIKAKEGVWGKTTCESLIAREIGLDMTQEMIQLSWGRPSNVDQKEVTRKNIKERWVYGQPRKGARYVWFTDGKVSKIKT